MLNLVYDSRELKLKEYLESTDKIQIIQEYLDLGVIIFRNDNKDVLVIERKTMCDLYSSIQDGRYKEQKIRLMNHYSNYQIVYIIEGTISCSSKFFKKAKPITDGALLNMTFRDKLNVIRTNDVSDTASILYKIGNKIIKNPEFFKNDSEINKINKINYLDTIKICKKDNMTPKLCNIVQLSQIPDVSKQMAEIIIEKYDSLSNLIMEYTKLNNLEDKQKLLKNIELTNKKIGPVISKRIYEFLFY